VVKWLLYDIQIASQKSKEEILKLLKEETDEMMLFFPDKKMNGRMQADDINVAIVLSKHLADPFKSRAIGKIEDHPENRILSLKIWLLWKMKEKGT
jgi:hypothetical protein